MRESQQGSPDSRARGCARHATPSAPLLTSPARIIDDYGYMTPHMLATKCCRECWMQMICLLLLRAESEGEHIDAVFVCSLHPRHGYACNRCDARRRSGFRSSIFELTDTHCIGEPNMLRICSEYARLHPYCHATPRRYPARPRNCSFNVALRKA